MRFDWKWFHFIPVIGFYLIPDTVKSEISNATDTYSGWDALVLMIICIEGISLLAPILIWALG